MEHWRGILYAAIGAFILAGLIDSPDSLISLQDRIFIFFIILVIGWAIGKVAEEDEKKEKEEKEIEEISKKYFGDKK